MKRKPERLWTSPNHRLTEKQEQMLRVQIRRNSIFIDTLIQKIDLLANKEGCPKNANTLLRLRKQLAIEVEENDNFRKSLWKHLRAEAAWKQMPADLPDPLTFLVNCIRTRQNSLVAQACWK